MGEQAGGKPTCVTVCWIGTCITGAASSRAEGLALFPGIPAFLGSRESAVGSRGDSTDRGAGPQDAQHHDVGSLALLRLAKYALAHHTSTSSAS